MAGPAIQPMTLEDFLLWDDGSDRRFELIGGFPVAMAPPTEAHSMLTVRLVMRIDAALSGRRPCRALVEAGVTRTDQFDSFFVADIAATCAPVDARRQAAQEPFLIVEIQSPSTERHDRHVKLPVYRQIETVQEILFVASDARYAELHRRLGALWVTEISRADGVLSLTSVGIEIPLADLYEGMPLDEP